MVPYLACNVPFALVEAVILDDQGQVWQLPESAQGERKCKT
ncbi:MAG: hypothetical protein ACREUK_12740 [Burkholderiales bacterium]